MEHNGEILKDVGGNALFDFEIYEAEKDLKIYFNIKSREAGQFRRHTIYACVKMCLIMDELGVVFNEFTKTEPQDWSIKYTFKLYNKMDYPFFISELLNVEKDIDDYIGRTNPSQRVFSSSFNVQGTRCIDSCNFLARKKDEPFFDMRPLEDYLVEFISLGLNMDIHMSFIKEERENFQYVYGHFMIDGCQDTLFAEILNGILKNLDMKRLLKKFPEPIYLPMMINSPAGKDKNFLEFPFTFFGDPKDSSRAVWKMEKKVRPFFHRIFVHNIKKNNYITLIPFCDAWGGKYVLTYKVYFKEIPLEKLTEMKGDFEHSHHLEKSFLGLDEPFDIDELNWEVKKALDYYTSFFFYQPKRKRLYLCYARNIIEEVQFLDLVTAEMSLPRKKRKALVKTLILNGLRETKLKYVPYHGKTVKEGEKYNFIQIKIYWKRGFEVNEEIFKKFLEAIKRERSRIQTANVQKPDYREAYLGVFVSGPSNGLVQARRFLEIVKPLVDHIELIPIMFKPYPKEYFRILFKDLFEGKE